MEIRQPLCITSRLLPGVEIGGAEISIEYFGVMPNNRQAYRWFIDNVECPVMQAGYYGVKQTYRKDFQGDKLFAGSGWRTLQEGMESLLGFLAAFAEAIGHGDRTGEETENMNLFPVGLEDWAVENADEIGALECELQEHPGELIVE